MDKVKEILLIALGIIIALACLWFFFTIALPIILVIILGVFIYSWLKRSDLFRKTNKKIRKSKEKVKDAVIIDEK